MKKMSELERLVGDIARLSAEMLFLTHEEGRNSTEIVLSSDDKHDVRFVAMLLEHVHRLISRLGTPEIRPASVSRNHCSILEDVNRASLALSRHIT